MNKKLYFEVCIFICIVALISSLFGGYFGNKVYFKKHPIESDINNSYNYYYETNDTANVEETPKEEVVEPKQEETSKQSTSPKPKLKSKPKTEKVVVSNNQTTKPQQPVENEEGNSTIKTGTFKCTAYCACSKCCGKWANGITASGTKATAGRTIAVDKNVIPLGTKVTINGHTYVAEDVGGAIKGNRIDIYFSSHEEAVKFGVKNLEASWEVK